MATQAGVHTEWPRMAHQSRPHSAVPVMTPYKLASSYIGGAAHEQQCRLAPLHKSFHICCIIALDRHERCTKLSEPNDPNDRQSFESMLCACMNNACSAHHGEGDIDGLGFISASSLAVGWYRGGVILICSPPIFHHNQIQRRYFLLTFT